jgi:hypothetical protein
LLFIILFFLNNNFCKDVENQNRKHRKTTTFCNKAAYAAEAAGVAASKAAAAGRM